jgi:A/G-specific adenine glycosylase
VMHINEDPILKAFPVSKMRRDLLRWWDYRKRYYPWRETQDPYKVLVAEILLHRTKANQVMPLYESFVQHFPDIGTLVQSSPTELAELFHSAGLHWRWKLLHAMSVELETKFNGQIPEDFVQLISLPGVSHYIASAVRCFAFNQPDAILDTNTVRVSGRLLGLPINDSSRRNTRFRAILQSLIDPRHPREFNFALIDLAAITCRTRSPCQGECPLRCYCHFYKESINTSDTDKRN